MKQHTRRLALAVGSALITTLGFLAACSTDNGSTALPSSSSSGGSSSGKSSSSGGSSSGDTTDDGGSSSGDGAASTADCGAAPKLRDNTNGFFCAFLTPPDGGSRNCDKGQTCCNPGKDTNGKFPNSYCAPSSGGADGPAACAAGATAAGSTWVATQASTWQCADNAACGSGQKCCMFTWADAKPGDKVNIGPSISTTIPKACGALQAFKAGGTHCEADCNADEIQLCSMNDDNCTGNQKCTPFDGDYRDLGYCK